MKKYSIFLFFLSVFSTAIAQTPHFGNGFHNGWADQHSIVIWTRLTAPKEMNWSGTKFKVPTEAEQLKLSKITDKKILDDAQVPEGKTLKEMVGACPGVTGEVRLTYFPKQKSKDKIVLEWSPVDATKNFTRQWRLTNLEANTQYALQIEARQDAQSPVSDLVKGFFETPAEADQIKDIKFVIVSCHDFIRRDDSLEGHKIYRAMLKNIPNFYVHTGDVEYYDKPEPYALTEELMRFKWDRLFALPLQRQFWTQTTTYFKKDDHDVLSDDASPGNTYGQVSFERGLEIFDKEQFPSNDSLYKTIRWGKDLQIWILEGRNFRSENDSPDNENKTILGNAQKEWLIRTLKSSTATFKIIITPTPILGPDRGAKNDNLSNKGFAHEGDEIRQFIKTQKNVFICTGDRHWQYVTHKEDSNLWEFGCGAGSDSHAGGWNESDRMPEHRFLRVKGGYLQGQVYREGGVPTIKFQHCDVEGNVVHEEVFSLK